MSNKLQPKTDESTKNLITLVQGYDIHYSINHIKSIYQKSIPESHHTIVQHCQRIYVCTILNSYNNGTILLVSQPTCRGGFV